jgi:hypothetical protein
MRFARAKTSAAFISSPDALPSGHLWYFEVDAAIAYAKFYSRSDDAVIHVYDQCGKVIEVHRNKGGP